MKYNVTIQNKVYVVEIEDINTRPVIALVDGQRFEVMPEANAIGSRGKPEVKKATQAVSIEEKVTFDSSLHGNELTAPLPGNVIEVFVKPGDEIEAGQVVVIIEAMKMKNSIRSTRPGKIAEVLVAAGQTVSHKQILVSFA